MKQIRQKARCKEVFVLNLPAELRANLSTMATLTGIPASEILRQALQESYLQFLTE